MANQKEGGSSRIWIPTFVALILLLVWSGYWLFGANWMKQKALQEIARLEAEGYQISYSDIEVHGWPYRFALSARQVGVILPPEQQSLQLYTPLFRVHAMAWKLSHLIIEVPQDSRIRDQQDQDWLYHSSRSRASLVFRSGQISRVSIEMLEPELTRASEEFGYHATRIEAHLRPGAVEDSRTIFAFATQPVWPEMPVQEISELRLQAEVFSWEALMKTRDLSTFRAASGHVVIEDAFLETPDSSAQISGALKIDQKGYLDGTVKVVFLDPADLFSKIDPTQLDDNSKKILAGISILTGGVKKTNLSFRLKKGGVYAGPFRLARTRPVLGP